MTQKKHCAQWSLIASACLVMTVANGKDDLSRPICVSSDGRFLTQTDGEPFFWLGDTAWTIFTRLTKEEADEYLRDRAAKGFTIIQAVALGGPLDDLSTPNRYGQLPLLDRDFARPNARFFEHVDWVVTRARQHGLRVAMLPLWAIDQVSFHRSLDERTAKTYGQWIGQRYSKSGIVWILGGDTIPMWRMPLSPQLKGRADWIGLSAASIYDFRPIYDAMAVGLNEGDGGDPFITFHPTNLSFSGTAQPRTSLYFHDRNWLDMNMLQSSHFIDPSVHLQRMGATFSWRAPFSYEPIAEEYRSSPVRPVVDGEPRFEDLAIDLDDHASKGYWSGYDARNAAYHALFAGAAGHTYGNHSIWQFVDPAHKRPYQLPREGVSWRLALTRASNSQMQYAKDLLLSRPYFTRIPDQSLIVSEQDIGVAHIGATRDRDGSYALVYVPQGQTVTLDMTKIAGSRSVAWWFDPRTGDATRIEGTFANNEYASFTAPSHGPEEDWILVLDDEARRFGPPGRGSLFRNQAGAPCSGQEKRLSYND